MKLYAKVTSERASKGQGGNDYLDIDLMVGSTDESIDFCRLTLRPVSDLPNGGSGYGLYDENDTLIKWLEYPRAIARGFIAEKGEKEKGECCSYAIRIRGLTEERKMGIKHDTYCTQ